MARNLKYTYWRDGEFFIGFLNDYPDYRTQGTSKEDLIENLKSLLEDIGTDEIPFIRMLGSSAPIAYKSTAKF
ncbi:MAG: type II toxin-antitoxin system HicB family antitoxin [Actinomycetota bacterium]